MQFSYSFLALAAIATLASAQTTIPICAQPCINAAVTAVTKCSMSDAACQCEPANAAAIQGAASDCVANACGMSGAANVLTAANAICAALSSSSAPATSSPATSAPATSVPATSVPATSVPATSVPATGAPASSSAVPPPSSTAMGTPSSSAPTTMMTVVSTTECGCTNHSKPTTSTIYNSTVTTSPPAQFTGAASQVVVGLGSVFALGFAALAAL